MFIVDSLISTFSVTLETPKPLSELNKYNKTFRSKKPDLVISCYYQNVGLS